MPTLRCLMGALVAAERSDDVALGPLMEPPWSMRCHSPCTLSTCGCHCCCCLNGVDVPPSYVGDKTPILHATAPNLMRARLKMQHGLPLESTMLNSAVDELQELAQEAAYAKRHMEMSARHAVQEFYKAKAKLKHCKQEIRAYIYEVDEAV